jgi:hypothetical protein
LRICRHLLFVTLSGAHAAQPAPTLENRYIAARDAASDQISKLYDIEKSDDGAREAEEEAAVQISSIIPYR